MRDKETRPSRLTIKNERTMKPYGREKKITAKWKIDFHLHPKHKVMNWWEDICKLIPRSTMKQKLKKEIENEI